MLKGLMHISLHRANNCLLGLIILINLYIIGAPLLPKITYWWQVSHTQTRQNIAKQVHAKPAVSPTQTAPSQPNQLLVPAMLLDTPILEGPVKDTYKILDQGIWRWPLGSTPDKGSNTILIGHRFTYTNPRGIFYYMDKIQMGDEIGLIWDNTHYVYKVTSINEVDPSDVAILAPTPTAQLTMYTCTPLWNPTHRLVVIAALEAKG